MPKKNAAPLLPDHAYHVYARTNNREPLFATPENYRFFLRRYGDFISPIAKTYAFCLLGNHVHFLIRLRSVEVLRSFCETLNLERAPGSDTFSKSIPSITPETVGSHQFQRFLTSYAKAFNKQQGRYGNLIQRPFKRKQIADEHHFFQTLYYIHHNARKHGLVRDFRDWTWSSYAAFLDDKPTRLERAEVLSWFGGVGHFVAFHEQLL